MKRLVLLASMLLAACSTPSSTPPFPVSTLEVQGVDTLSKTFTLTWKHDGKNTSGYAIYKIDGTVPHRVKTVASPAKSVRLVFPKGSYTFKVTAYENVASVVIESGLSNPVVVKL